MKDENKLDELLDVLRYFHSSVPKTSDNELNLKLCFGQEVSHSWPLLKVQKMVCASDNAQHRLPAIEDSMTEWLPKPTPADILISYRSHPIAVSCCNRFFASIMMNLVCGCKGR